MATVLFSPGIIVAIAILVLPFVLIGSKVLNSVFGKSGSAPKDRRVSWYGSCYEPCMKKLEQSSDSCVMRCSWNSL